MGNNTWKKLTALLLSLTLLLSCAQMTAFAGVLTPETDDQNHYYVNMNATGTDTLDLSDKTNGYTCKIYDVGGENGTYTNNCDSRLLITAPDGYRLKISGSGNTENNYDYLYIYDGDTTEPLGQNYYCGSFTVEEMYSKTGALTVKFTSDTSQTYAGFALDVTVVDPSTVAEVVYAYTGSVHCSVVPKGTEIALPVFADLFTAPAGSTFLGWQCGETLYDEGAAYTVNENVTFHAQTQEPQVVFGDDDTGWYANMPVTGTATADLSDKQDGFVLHVYDDGGADATYSNSCNGYLRIVAPANYVLKVSGSGRSESTSYDWLTIYDGDTTNVLGSNKYAGRPFTVPELTTTGNVLKLFFRSDSSDTYDGLDLTVMLIDYSNYSHVTYSYNGTEKSSLIENGTQIQLSTFTSMFTLPERYHFTAWQSDGTDYAENETYTVNGDVTFTALVEEDPILFEDGEGGYYAKLPKTGTLTADLSQWSAGDTLKVYDNGGKDNPYSYSCDGYLRIVAPEGYRLSVNGTYSTYSYYDWIYLYDGDTSTQLGPQFMGYNKTMNDYYTTGNVLIVYLYSYYGDSNMGCDLNVTIVDPDDLVTVSFDPGEGSGTMAPMQALPGARIVLPECGFTLPNKTYFDYYTDGTNTYNAGAVYPVTGDATLTAAYVEKIIATYQLGAQTATAEYRKGTRLDLPYFTEYFTLPYRTEFYRWESGGNEYYERQSYTFNEDVTFTAVLNQLPVLIEKDDGSYYAALPKNEHVQADLRTGYPNGLTFTLYDNGEEYGGYASNCDGSLTFTAPDGYVFLISGSVNTERGNADVLSLYDSDLTTLLGGQSYSGTATISELRTTSNVLKVAFESDSTVTYDGFALTIRMIDQSSLITVSFDAGEGSGTMDPLTQIAGEAFTLPDYGFTAPEGKIFSGYSDGSNIYWPGTVTFNESKTLTALWEAATGITYSCNGEDQAIRYAKGSTVTLPALTDLFTQPDGLIFVGWEEKFSGDLYQPGDPYVANDPTVFTAVLEFLQSDGNGGWYANMPLNNPNDELTLDLSDKESGFSFTLYDGGGADGDYSEYNNGVLIVKAPENMVVTVSGSGRTESGYDFLRFYDGASAAGSSILGNSKYSGSFSIDEEDPLTSSGKNLMIYFCSDSSYNYPGFALTVTVLAQNQVAYVFGEETQQIAVQKDTTIRLKYFDDLFESDTEEFLYWQVGDDTFDEGDEFYVSEDVTFTAVTRRMPTVILDGNGATVKAEFGGDGVVTTLGPISFPTGTTDSLPHATYIFNFPANQYFGGWAYNGTVYNVGEDFTITEDVTFTAIWRDASAWELLNEQLQTATGTITLTEDVTAAIGSLPLSVPAGVTVTIDLNGYTLDGTQAAANDGNIITVYGDLTIIDSSGNGTVTGGGVTAFESGTFNPDGTVAECFAATVKQRYRANDANNNYENFVYSVSWYPTFADAMNAASTIPEFEESLTLPEGMTFRWYLLPIVTMLQDVTIAAGETLTVNADEGFELDLNGHTFDVQGTFTGGTPGWRYEDGEYVQVIYPTDVQIVSETTPGVFRSSGTIEVNLSPWTEDTYYFTGGTVSGFIGADGGTFHISGGHFTEIVMFNNGNEDANLEIDLSGDAEFDRLEHMIYANEGGDAEFDRLEHMIYANEGGPAIHMTISDNVRVGAMLFEIMGDGVVNDTVLTVNGGYFTVDPTTWLDTAGAGENAVQILGAPEQYVDQTDWAADSAVYTWRVKPTTVAAHSLTLDGTIGVNFYVDVPQATDAAYAEFTVDGVTTQVPIDLTNFIEQDGLTLYKFTCNVAAAQIDTPITGKIVNGDTESAPFTYSVQTYLTEAQQTMADKAKFMALAGSLATYGYYANELFDYNDAFTQHALFDDGGFANVTAESLADYEAQISNEADGVNYVGSSLVLRTETAIRHYFTLPAGATLDDYTFLLGESENATALTPQVSGSFCYVEIPNIPSAELGAARTVTVLDGDGNAVNTWIYSALSYAQKVLTKYEANDPSVSEDLANACKALTLYYQAADAYFAQQNG
ncbi:MAG: InlB B-repeat-containing protein [Clostridia bacterium]|nr:InlB B-repeat-containing protein [Clostridia bacterium]